MNFPQFEQLVKIIAKLRDPQDGCPWDLEQTHQSLLKYLVEESYEYLHAAEENIPTKMEEELGDVLLQILLHSQIAAEKNNFTFESICQRLTEKLIRRHPHVFSKQFDKINSSQVVTNWQEIKKSEKKDMPVSRIDDSFLHFPSLMAAEKIGKKTAQIKFDWNSPQEVQDVVEDEWKELKKELHDHNCAKIEEELGDLLFSLAQLARHLKIDPEFALRGANRKFIRRFQQMEEMIAKDGQHLEKMDQKEMDVYWKKVKEQE